MEFPSPAAPASRFAGLRRRATAAFTIAEVMMSTFVLALGIATSIIAMQSGYKQIDLARGTTLAAQIMASEMERIRLMSWTTVFAMASAAGSPSGQAAGVTVFDGATYFSTNIDLAGKYTITRTVAVDSARPTEAVNITVSVRWQTYDLRWHQRSFTAMYAKNGLYDYYYTKQHS
jgi:hypothetical protein